ncbi:ATP-binding protein [Streptomyces bottropensis]|uniref:ATP-binding protein n=1 Tax=Streptomyces bottropensis TaxID=42235 RepID=UPI0036C27436
MPQFEDPQLLRVGGRAAIDEKSIHLDTPTRHFSVLLSPTPRGARLARLLATEWLRAWGPPYGALDTAEHLVAELATNAATHGRLPGRDFRLVLQTRDNTLRIEVTDTPGDDLPCRRPPGPVPRKTVWAELDLNTVALES